MPDEQTFSYITELTLEKSRTLAMFAIKAFHRNVDQLIVNQIRLNVVFFDTLKDSVIYHEKSLVV